MNNASKITLKEGTKVFKKNGKSGNCNESAHANILSIYFVHFYSFLFIRFKQSINIGNYICCRITNNVCEHFSISYFNFWHLQRSFAYCIHIGWFCHFCKLKSTRQRLLSPLKHVEVKNDPFRLSSSMSKIQNPNPVNPFLPSPLDKFLSEKKILI